MAWSVPEAEPLCSLSLYIFSLVALCMCQVAASATMAAPILVACASAAAAAWAVPDAAAKFGADTCQPVAAGAVLAAIGKHWRPSAAAAGYECAQSACAGAQAPLPIFCNRATCRNSFHQGCRTMPACFKQKD